MQPPAVEMLPAVMLQSSTKASRCTSERRLFLYAGTGRLAMDILNWLRRENRPLYDSTNYRSIEISPSLASVQLDRLHADEGHREHFKASLRSFVPCCNPQFMCSNDLYTERCAQPCLWWWHDALCACCKPGTTSCHVQAEHEVQMWPRDGMLAELTLGAGRCVQLCMHCCSTGCLSSPGGAGGAQVHEGDATQPGAWGAPSHGPCFIVMMEVLDNCPHDKVQPLLSHLAHSADPYAMP